MIKEAAIGLIWNSDGEILLVKRRDVPVWVLPGGGIDSNETPEEAVVREVLEETGLTVKIKRKIAEYIPINRLAKPTHLFECLRLEGELSLGDETQDIGYFPLDSLPNSLFPPHREWIFESIENNKGLRKPLTQVTYLKVLRYFLRHPFWFMRFLIARLR